MSTVTQLLPLDERLSSQDMTDLRTLIVRAGGLHRSSDLARRWGVTRARADQLTKADDFPEPVTHLGEDGGSPVWTGKEADEWRATPRRPGPRPQ